MSSMNPELTLTLDEAVGEVLGLTISADSAWGRALGAVDMATMPEDDGELPDPLAAARREERLLTAPVAAGK